YVRRFGLGLEDLRLEPDARLPGVVYFDQRRRRETALLTPAVRRGIDRFWARVGMLASPLDPEDPVAGGAQLDAHSAAWLIDRFGMTGTARRLLEHRIRDEFTVAPERLSLLFLCQRARRMTGQPASGVAAFRIHGGNDQLPTAFADALLDLRLLTPVHSVELHPGGVRVGVRGGSEVVARYCVLAAPLPAVRQLIQLSPEPPRPLREAVARL